MKRYGLAAAAVLLSVQVLASAPADTAFSFAEKLLAEGDEAFALLEFKRFIHTYPADPRAPDASLKVAMIYLTYVGDVARAQTTLKTITASYPKAKAATQAEQLRSFVEVNSDFSGKPLIEYLRGKASENRGDAAAAVTHFLSVSEKWPRARLGAESLLSAAKLQLEPLGKTAEAVATLRLLVTRYPKSPLLSDAEYELAAAVEKQNGPGTKAIEAYRSVAARYPQTDAGKRARERVTALERASHALKRQYGKDFVRSFNVVKEGQSSRREYTVLVQLSMEYSEREVRATIEDALLKHYEKRAHPKDRVTVEAFYNYPVTKAGKVEWTPGRAPVYSIRERKTEDVLKDVFIDLLKKR